MRHVLLALVTYFALAAHAACGASLAIGDCRLPLMWLPLVLAQTWFADARGIAWAALIGLLADGLSSGRLGQEMLATTLAAAITLPLRPEARSRTGLPVLVWRFALIGSGLLLSRGYGGLFEGSAPLTIGALPLLAVDAAYGVLVFGIAAKVVGTFHVPSVRQSESLRC